jgi:tRNA pseudouridine55 synthase
MEGLLLIDKPTGVSSFGVVAKVRGCIRATTGIKKIKVGHIGTLDPAATGLLVLAIGKYTKKVPDLIGHDKTYIVEATLGYTSTTGDIEGELSSVSKSVPTLINVHEVMRGFIGEQLQIPPAFSAIKINGQRAYDLARKGKPVELKARPVTIYSIEDIEYDYPKVHFTATVSSGTYIRSLVEDIGTKLTTGAYMSALRRIAIGEFSINGALKLEDVTIETVAKHLSI